MHYPGGRCNNIIILSMIYIMLEVQFSVTSLETAFKSNPTNRTIMTLGNSKWNLFVLLALFGQPISFVVMLTSHEWDFHSKISFHRSTRSNCGRSASTSHSYRLYIWTDVCFHFLWRVVHYTCSVHQRTQDSFEQPCVPFLYLVLFFFSSNMVFQIF